MPKREYPVEADVQALSQFHTQARTTSSQKRQKLHVDKTFHTGVAATHVPQKQLPLESEGIRRLDPTNLQEARRMNTRFKMISKGKNTVGYDEYLKQVPKEKRRKIPEHPVTPDHTLDIPNRRWQGQVKAWRISLHKYDPKDLSSIFPMDCVKKEEQSSNNLRQGSHVLNSRTEQDKQIAMALMRGLQVDVSSDHGITKSEDGQCVQDYSSVVGSRHQKDEEAEAWENIEDQLIDDEDSDDDLL